MGSARPKTRILPPQRASCVNQVLEEALPKETQPSALVQYQLLSARQQLAEARQQRLSACGLVALCVHRKEEKSVCAEQLRPWFGKVS